MLFSSELPIECNKKFETKKKSFIAEVLNF